MNITLDEFFDMVHMNQLVAVRDASTQEKVFLGEKRELTDEIILNSEVDLVTTKGSNLVIYVWLPRNYTVLRR